MTLTTGERLERIEVTLFEPQRGMLVEHRILMQVYQDMKRLAFAIIAGVTINLILSVLTLAYIASAR